MNYTIDERGIHFVIDEPQPIPLDVAVKEVERIAAQNERDLERCTQMTSTIEITVQST